MSKLRFAHKHFSISQSVVWNKIKVKDIWGWKDSTAVKHLPYEHEEQSSSPQNPGKCWLAMVAYLWVELQRAEWEDIWRKLASETCGTGEL